MSSQTQDEDMRTSDTSPDRPFFDGAIEAIQHTLSDEHRRAIQHVNAMVLLNELRSVAALNDAGDRGLAASSRKFALFVQTFAPYFNVLSICTQVKPEWPTCFWGLVGVIFQVARNHMLFLEKIADMFEAMASVLPPYHQIYAICKRRIGNVQISVEDDRLSMLMSYTFLDIVNMLLDVYHIFFREPLGSESRNMSFSSPFSTTQWRPMDSRFAHLENRLTHHRRWLEKETENQVQDFAEIEHHRKAYVRLLHRHRDAPINGELEEERMAKRMRRVDIVRRWISKSSHPVNSGESTRVEHLGSCNWFLELPKYRAWKSRPYQRQRANDAEALQNDWHDRILFVQAEMGYGKSVLANAVADDLSAEAEDIENDKQRCTAHFRVPSSHSDSISPDHIFRHLALRILHDSRYDHKTLDAVCLLLRKTSFQNTASADEVLDFLAILLRQRPTFLVIDGVEDCSDVKGLLSNLANVCRKADSRAIIFSRLAITIPLEYQKWASDAPHIMRLDGQHNAKARESFVVRQIDQMADQGYFGLSMDRTLTSHVVQITEGSFLWANLLLSYLRSNALSPDDRLIVLQNVQSLQGLEALYSNMIRTLGRRPAHEKRIIADVFRWLSFPVHRLCISALRTALTSSVDFIENEELYPTDILLALPTLTCGLVEVTDDSVSFNHPSVRAFLQSQASQGSEFSLWDESSVHAHLTARCLSYLAHNVPQRPLGGLSPRIRPMVPGLAASSGASYRTSKSGDSGYKSLSSSDGDNALPHPVMQVQHNNASSTSIRIVPFDTNLPFLRYASLCWPIHLSRALSPSQDHHTYIIPTPGPFSAVPYIPALSAFLASRLAVTAWVEASFRYSLPPTLTRLVGPLSDLKAEFPPATIEGRELRLVVNELGVLSERLMELKRGYATSLRENPSLIWQMDEGMGEAYWPVWEGSTGMPR